jgi:hypothetical protein
VESDEDDNEEEAEHNTEEVLEDVLEYALMESEDGEEDANPISKKERSLSSNGIFRDT